MNVESLEAWLFSLFGAAIGYGGVKLISHGNSLAAGSERFAAVEARMDKLEKDADKRETAAAESRKALHDKVDALIMGVATLNTQVAVLAANQKHLEERQG